MQLRMQVCGHGLTLNLVWHVHPTQVHRSFAESAEPTLSQQQPSVLHAEGVQASGQSGKSLSRLTAVLVVIVSSC